MVFYCSTRWFVPDIGEIEAAGRYPGDGDGTLTAPEFLICCERLMGPSKVGLGVKGGVKGRSKQHGKSTHLF